MRNIKIVADSSADIFHLKGCEFAYAPMKVNCREREFVDDEQLDVDEKEEFANADVTVDLPRGLCSFYIERGGVLVGFEKGLTARA